MNIDPKYLAISFEGVGIRNSQKRLKSLIVELAVEPLHQYVDTLSSQFDLVEAIVLKRTAAVIAYWCQHKHHPASPKSHDLMSTITNSTKNDITLEAFYLNEVKAAMYTLAPVLSLDMPDPYTPRKTDDLEYALMELEEMQYLSGAAAPERHEEDEPDDDELDFSTFEDETYRDMTLAMDDRNIEEDFAALAELVTESVPTARADEPGRRESAIVSARPNQVIEVPPQEIQLDVVNMTTEQAWHLIYGLIGYSSEYIQQSMLPRWQQNPDAFDKDRRFLYGLFIDTIRNTAGAQHIAGGYYFADRRLTIDQLWNHYFTDLSQHVAPQLTAARMHEAVHAPWYKKLLQSWGAELQNVSIIWMIALIIALIFDGLTTYISLDQTPMEGIIVPIFTVLITALFQIADQLVISYRRREFDAEAMGAKYRAQYERLAKALAGLQITSESYVQLSMDKSKAHSDWKAAEDNRRMARRGRFWSARIADINIVITAYGFSYLFLNSKEPMYALAQQVDYIFVKGTWEHVDLWVFLMIGLAVTVSFVVNTAQRTEILGWAMRRMKKEA